MEYEHQLNMTQFPGECMKKFLITMSCLFLSLPVFGKETITLVYSWNVGDAAANFYRTLIEESNRSQNQYQFVFEARPGAGGSVAAKHVESNPANTVLANSSALFIRPVFFPAESHDVSKFRSLMPMCSAPMLITSTKYSSWKEVPPQAKLSIGVSGLGTTTHLVAEQIASRYPNMQVIPFKSTSEALLGVLSNTTDFAVNFTGDVDSWLKTNASNKQKLYVLGTTGKTQVRDFPLLANQGFPKNLADMSSMQQLFAPVRLPQEKFQDIRKIFFEAAKHKSVRDANAVDSCIPNSMMPDNEIAPWFNYQNARWKAIAESVKK